MNRPTGTDSLKGRVLLAGKFYPPQYVGGIEFAMQDLASGLRRYGVCADVIVSSRNGGSATEVISGVTVHRVRRMGRIGSVPLSPGYLLRMRELLRDNDYDAVHLQYPYPVAELSCLLSRIKARLVVTYHTHAEYNTWLKKPYYPFMRWLFRKADHIIVTSEGYLDEAVHLKDYRRKCVVVPLFIKEEWFEPPSPEAVAGVRARYSPFIFYAGRLVESKGVQDLLRAAGTLEYNVVIAGEGPYLDTLKAHARDAGIEKRVFFLGPLEKERLKVLFYAADIFCLPSHKESFGFVLLEAMAAGVPVVSTELGGGTKWVNVHGETGLVVPPGDVDKLRHAIMTLAADGRLRRQMGSSARERVKAHFSESIIMGRIIELYGIRLRRSPANRNARPGIER